MLKKALIWGIVGLGVAVILLIISLFTQALAYVELVLWPASLAFMALDNATTTRLDWVGGTAFLILTNFVLYFVVGLLVTVAWKGLTRLRGHRTAPSDLG